MSKDEMKRACELANRIEPYLKKINPFTERNVAMELGKLIVEGEFWKNNLLNANTI